MHAVEDFADGALGLELMGVKLIRAFDANVVIVSATQRSARDVKLVGCYLADEDAMRDASRVESELGSGSDQQTRIGVAVLVARAQLALGDAAAASHALDTVRAIAEKTEQIEPRELFVLADAQVDAAHGRTDRARERLTSARPRLARAGMVLAGFECDAELLRLDRAEGRSTFRADANTLQEKASARGAGLIVRRLQAL